MVSKEARVTEEVVVRKDVEQRTETISDTVRKTEVDVEDERNVRGTGTTGSTDARADRNSAEVRQDAGLRYPRTDQPLGCRTLGNRVIGIGHAR